MNSRKHVWTQVFCCASSHEKPALYLINALSRECTRVQVHFSWGTPHKHSLVHTHTNNNEVIHFWPSEHLHTLPIHSHHQISKQFTFCHTPHTNVPSTCPLTVRDPQQMEPNFCTHVTPSQGYQY